MAPEIIKKVSDFLDKKSSKEKKVKDKTPSKDTAHRDQQSP